MNVTPKNIGNRTIVATRTGHQVETLQVSPNGMATVFAHTFGRKTFKSSKPTQNHFVLCNGPVDFVQNYWDKRVPV
jgi:hypothetical protein